MINVLGSFLHLLQVEVWLRAPAQLLGSGAS